MKTGIIILFVLLSLLPVPSVFSEEHTVERGETALQIAIDHDLTIEQLSRLNPGVDLEMMIVGDILNVPEKGVSFEEYLNRYFSEMIRITDLNCEILADQSGLCLFHAENKAEIPLYDVTFKGEISGTNGIRGQAEGAIPMIQILPGEKLPLSLKISGPFDAVGSTSVSVQNLSGSEMFQSSFRISPEYYTKSERFLPDGSAASVTIFFNEAAISVYRDKHINVLAAAYDAEGVLTGVRSLYTDFYPRLDLSVYSNNHQIDHTELRLEAY